MKKKTDPKSRQYASMLWLESRFVSINKIEPFNWVSGICHSHCKEFRQILSSLLRGVYVPQICFRSRTVRVPAQSAVRKQPRSRLKDATRSRGRLENLGLVWKELFFCHNQRWWRWVYWAIKKSRIRHFFWKRKSDGQRFHSQSYLNECSFPANLLHCSLIIQRLLSSNVLFTYYVKVSIWM